MLITELQQQLLHSIHEMVCGPGHTPEQNPQQHMQHVIVNEGVVCCNHSY